MTDVFVKWIGSGHRRMLTNYDFSPIEGAGDEEGNWEAIWEGKEKITAVDSRIAEVLTTLPEFMLASPDQVAVAESEGVDLLRLRAQSLEADARAAQEQADKAKAALKDAEDAAAKAQSDAEAAAEAEKQADIDAQKDQGTPFGAPQEVEGDLEVVDESDDAPDES